MRTLSILAFVLASLATFGPASAQTYDQADIKAHLSQMYRFHGERLLTWKQPISYVVKGLENEESKQVVDTHFAYVAELTGLGFRKADTAQEEANFLLIFANPIVQIADDATLRPIFDQEGLSDADYRKRLEKGGTRFVFRRDDDSILLFAALANLTLWEGEDVDARFLKLIVTGLTKTIESNEVRPSIWNGTGTLQPLTRLPSIDEAYLRALYRDGVRTEVPIEAAVRDLAAAIATHLAN